MLFRYLIYILGLNSWELRVPYYINLFQQKRKLSTSAKVIINKRSNHSRNYSPASIKNIYEEDVEDEYKKATLKDKIHIFLYNIWTITIFITQLIQPIHLIYKSIENQDNNHEYINLLFIYTLMPLHYIWAKIYFNTNHFESTFINSHYTCSTYCYKLSILSIIMSILSIIPYIFLEEQVSHYWSSNSSYFWFTFAIFEFIGRNIIIINSGVFILIFSNHIHQLNKFIEKIDSGNYEYNFSDFTILSNIIINITKIRSDLNCSIERFESLVSLTTAFGGISTILFVNHKYVTNNLNFTPTEIYIFVSLTYFLLSQCIFFGILYKYSSIRNKIHIYINSNNFISKYISRTMLKKNTSRQVYESNLFIIEEESATTIDWILLDRLTKENWIDFSIVGISTRDGSLIKKVITFASLFYTLLKFF